MHVHYQKQIHSQKYSKQTKSIQNRPNRFTSMPFAARRKNSEKKRTLFCKPELQTLSFQVISFSVVMAILDTWCFKTC